jgi:hypothetical protein
LFKKKNDLGWPQRTDDAFVLLVFVNAVKIIFLLLYSFDIAFQRVRVFCAVFNVPKGSFGSYHLGLESKNSFIILKTRQVALANAKASSSIWWKRLILKFIIF